MLSKYILPFVLLVAALYLVYMGIKIIGYIILAGLLIFVIYEWRSYVRKNKTTSKPETTNT